jgi:hypothetical protein
MMPLLALCLGYFMTILDVTIVWGMRLAFVIALVTAWVFVNTLQEDQETSERSSG